MIIRRLHPEDWQDYRTVRLRALSVAPDAFGSTYETEAAMPMETFTERLGSSMVMGAYEAKCIVGMAGYKRAAGLRDAHKAFVWGVFVEPQMQRGGIGEALMQALIAAARKDVEQLTLAVVADNLAARGLYERLGFQAFGLEPRALRTAQGYADEVLMVLFL